MVRGWNEIAKVFREEQCVKTVGDERKGENVV